jgi:hypothetical protein
MSAEFYRKNTKARLAVAKTPTVLIASRTDNPAGPVITKTTTTTKKPVKTTSFLQRIGIKVK